MILKIDDICSRNLKLAIQSVFTLDISVTAASYFFSSFCVVVKISPAPVLMLLLVAIIAVEGIPKMSLLKLLLQRSRLNVKKD